MLMEVVDWIVDGAGAGRAQSDASGVVFEVVVSLECSVKHVVFMLRGGVHVGGVLQVGVAVRGCRIGVEYNCCNCLWCC